MTMPADSPADLPAETAIDRDLVELEELERRLTDLDRAIQSLEATPEQS